MKKMERNNPKDPRDQNLERPASYDFPDQTPRREGGEDSAEHISPTDDNADEKDLREKVGMGDSRCAGGLRATRAADPIKSALLLRSECSGGTRRPHGA